MRARTAQLAAGRTRQQEQRARRLAARRDEGWTLTAPAEAVEHVTHWVRRRLPAERA